MKSYTDIFFDLDRTIWDFDRNSEETLNDLYDHYKLTEELKVEFNAFFQKFQEINGRLWHEYRNKEKSKEEVRFERFVGTFFHFKSGNWKLAREMSGQYIAICPKKTSLKEGAIELLDYLQPSYNLHIITNGFSETQHIKIDHAGIREYFDHIIISDEVKSHKPHPEIFKVSLEKAGCNVEEAIMIGDDWKGDIVGAKSIGMDQVYYENGEAIKRDFEPTIRVKNLKELTNFF